MRAAAILFIVASASAQQIDLSALPPRDAVQLTIYNSEDITLVREMRHVTLKKGANELQFSWANTLIDPTSVTLLFRDHAKELDLVDTRFPHERPQVLYWNVKSQFDGDATVEISYFTSGLTWAADYVGVTDSAERAMSFDGFVSITNNSGENYENAQVRMVVGTINLVEQIAELAQRGIIYNEARSLALQSGDVRNRLQDGLKSKLERPPAPSSGIMFDDQAAAAPEIVKEGLSEYFIFTVSGTHTVNNGWSKRMRLFEGTKVPFKTIYRYRPSEYGDQLVRMFLVRNDEASTLGDSPLPDGAVRLFRQQPTGGLSVISFNQTKYVPIGQEFEFNLGRDPQVIWEHTSARVWRDEFWFQRRDPSKLYSPDKGERIEPNDSVSGWTAHHSIVERVRNYRGEPIEVEFRFPLDGDVTFKSGLSPTLFDFRTPDFKSSVKPGETKELAYEVQRREGTNAKQDAVVLENR